MNPLLQVGSGSVEKSTGSGYGFGGPKINASDRIRILIPVQNKGKMYKKNSKKIGLLYMDIGEERNSFNIRSCKRKK